MERLLTLRVFAEILKTIRDFFTCSSKKSTQFIYERVPVNNQKFPLK